MTYGPYGRGGDYDMQLRIAALEAELARVKAESLRVVPVGKISETYHIVYTLNDGSVYVRPTAMKMIPACIESVRCRLERWEGE